MWPFSSSKPAQPEETKSIDSLPWESMVDLLAGTAGGMPISAEAALRVPAVAAAVRVISEAAASLDIKFVRGKDEVDHPARRLLQEEANDWLSSFELVRGLVVQALTQDSGGLAWVNRVGGKPVEVILYDPGNIQVTYSTQGTGEPEYRLANKVVPARDIIHVAGPFRRCPLTLACEAIGLAALMERHGAGLWRNGARPGGVLSFEGRMTADAVKRIGQSWAAAHGGSKTGGVAVLDNKGKYEPIAFTSTDAQYLENRRFQVLEISRAFRVPPSMLYDLERVTWSNGEQMGKEFLTYSLEPWLLALEAAFMRALLTPKERKSGLRIVFDRDDLTRADLGARATAYSSLVSSRVYNPNELRAWDGMPPYEGGDEFVNPAITPGAAANDNKPKEPANAA
ncbi:HK97 family phage portal protein [Sinorhizobium fredii]|uniref:phage portal protein n=1 Tax=Rhizobium fredii TaxID=380 RepID=UPI003511127D